MLKEKQRQLLVLFLDGEATPEQRRVVAELLRDSPEARQYLHALQRDSGQLSALPKVKLPEGFSDAVCEQIRRRDLPTPQRILPFVAPRRHGYSWARFALAASVALAFGATAFWLLNSSGRREQQFAQASRPAVNPPSPEKGDLASLPPKKTMPDDGSAKVESKLPDLSVGDLQRSAEMVAALVGPLKDSMDTLAHVGVEIAAKESARNSILGSHLWPAMPMKSHVLHLPPLEELRNFDQDKVRHQLNEAGPQQIDISCVESWKALERFQEACKASGVKVVVDPEAAFRQSKKLPAMYVVYLENVPVDRVLKILTALQAEDKKAETKSKGDAQFNSVWVTPLEDSLRKWVADMLGVPAANLILPKATPKSSGPPIDPTKPLAQDTQKSLEKIGPGGKTNGKEPTALVLFSGTVRTPMQMTKEVKQFVEGRSAPQADAIHVVFLLRPTKG